MKRHHFYPFGQEVAAPAATDIPLKFTGHERDPNQGGRSTLDYMHARYHSPVWGRFLSVDPARGNAADPQPLNRYAYARSNPINNVDPLGLNWFNVNGEWRWGEGSTLRVDGKTYTSSYTHIVIFKKVGTNSQGGTTGTLEIRKQDEAVVTAEVFSGGAQEKNKTYPEAPDGSYMLRLDIPRNPADEASDIREDRPEPHPNYGFQEISAKIIAQGVTIDLFSSWGNARVYMNPPPGESGMAHLGLYLHGKGNEHVNVTHGCVADRSEASLNYLRSLDPKLVPRVPMWVKR